MATYIDWSCGSNKLSNVLMQFNASLFACQFIAYEGFVSRNFKKNDLIELDWLC